MKRKNNRQGSKEKSAEGKLYTLQQTYNQMIVDLKLALNLHMIITLLNNTISNRG